MFSRERFLLAICSRSTTRALTCSSSIRIILSGSHSRPRKSAQDDKWNFCLTTAIIAANRRDHEQTTALEPYPGFQGKGGACRRQGRSNGGAIGRAFRRPSQSDYGVEGAARGRSLRGFWIGEHGAGRAGRRREVAPRQSR